LDDRHGAEGSGTSTAMLLDDAPQAALVALIGPPNSGKTTLFNRLTGLRQKVANYPGVTVEKHVGRAQLPDERVVDVVDLPGVHGFSARTLDEKITRDVLEGRMEGFRAPDALPGIAEEAVSIDAGNLWCQFSVIHEEGARIAAVGGLSVVMDRCFKVEHARYVGRMHWLGFNTRRVTALRGGRQ